MNESKKCLVGRDSDDAGGILFIIIMVIVIVSAVLFLIFCGGAIIGGFHALKNYFISFKENVIDSNRKPVAAV